MVRKPLLGSESALLVQKESPFSLGRQIDTSGTPILSRLGKDAMQQALQQLWIEFDGMCSLTGGSVWKARG